MNNETFTPAQILGYAVLNTAAKYLDCRGTSAKALVQADGSVTLRIIADSVAQGKIAYDIAERVTGVKVETYEIRVRRVTPAGERHVPPHQKGYFTETGKYVAQIDNV